MLVWYLIVSELNPGYNGIDDGYDARAPQDSIRLIGWNPDISEERKRVILQMKLQPQVIGCFIG